MKKMITEHAALLRLNRKLAKDGQKVCRSRLKAKNDISGGTYGDLGRFYVINELLNTIEYQGIDLEAWLREAGALKEYESVDYS
ncbi:hypothetical protein LZ640_01630 [Aeromonas media]|uniref:hypothetical protein n=1 Tax=Aeromonas TaxID=642 RepID=UPI001F3352F3|nr:hypothetical protein [Aeromonas media]MCE9923185.1 hypothetical protein [Aeromonas media]HEH9397766.1 hypothetical protein [Aeromonas salmonicida]